MDELSNRRPIKARGSGWARGFAAWLAHHGAMPDLISAASVAFAVLGGALMLAAGAASGQPLVRAAFLIAAAGCIQLRLLCNLLDGMVAVEHGRGSAAGPIWNELPDRISDAVLLVAAGYAAGAGGVRFAADAGWLCAVLALMTAYVRELGRDLGLPADYAGPMAKQQRMAVLTLACGVAALEPLWGWRGLSLMIGLLIVALGAAITTVRRTRTIARRLADRAGAGGTQS
jgi:phosphatidylglycerophosphate synthase